MEYLLHFLARYWDLSPTQFWHLHLLTSLLLGPTLGVLYLVFFDKREPPRPRTATSPKLGMWVDSHGRLVG